MTWLSQLFIHPAMAAGGAALIAVPIIIHLINRLRYRKVRFAAMEFLLQSQQQNRKRILIEQLLLLLLRILIVLGIVALFARLVLNSSALSLLERPQTHHLIVLDDSGSMRDHWGETTAWKKGLDAVKRIASEMANQEGVHTLTLIQTSEPDRTTSNFTRREIDVSMMSELEDKLDTMQRDCSFARPLWANTFTAIDRVLSAGDEDKSIIHVISDFRHSEWGESPTLTSDIEALASNNRTVNLVPVIPSQHENLAVTFFGGELHTAAVMVPVKLTAEITNYGELLVENVTVRVLIDGEPIPQSISIPSLNPGESVRESFEVTLTTPGEHALAVQIPADALDADNYRFLTLNVPEKQRVLIADGSDQTEEAQFIADAISADSSITGIEVVIVRSEDLRDQNLTQFSTIYLLNTPRLPVDAQTQLARYVEQGGGIAWFMGDQVDGSFYQQLAKKKQSLASKQPATEPSEEPAATSPNSLFPAIITLSPAELERADETNPGADLILSDHPLFEILNAENALLANFINIYRYFPLDVSEGNALLGSAHVIGTLRNQAPIFLESRLGEGRIFISLTSAGPMNPDTSDRWHNWPFDINAPGFTVFHLELVKYLGSRQGTRSAAQIEEPLIVQVNPSAYTQEVRFTPPEGLGLSTVTILATPESELRSNSPNNENTKSNETETPESTILYAQFTATGKPGIYRVGRENLAREVETDFHAYNVPYEEGQLALTTPVELRAKLSAIEGVIVQDIGQLVGIEREDPGRELRTLLLLLLVLILIAEQLLAYRLSFHSSPSGSTSGERSSRSHALHSGDGMASSSKQTPSPVHPGGNLS